MSILDSPVTVTPGELAKSSKSFPGRMSLNRDVTRGIRDGPALPAELAVGHSYAASRETWGSRWRSGAGIFIVLVEGAADAFSVAGNTVVLRPGELMVATVPLSDRPALYSSNTAHTYWLTLHLGTPPRWTWPSWLMITQRDLEEMSSHLRGKKYTIRCVDDDIGRCFREVQTVLSLDRSGSHESWLRLRVSELILLLAEVLRREHSPVHLNRDASGRVASFLAQLPERVDLHWTVESMADECQLGVTRFVHYCKLITDTTPLKYLTTLRLKRAAEALLASPTSQITAIAFEYGFTSSQYFATVFRKHYHCTPQEYRESRMRGSAPR